jgi:hypothetical protein
MHALLLALTLVGLLKQQHTDAAGCALQLAGAPPEHHEVFEWDFDAPTAWMHLGGHDVELSVVSEKEVAVRRGRQSIGDRRMLHLRGHGYDVRLETRATTECRDDDESCEAWTEEGTIAVKSRAGSETVRVRGICGT